MTAPPPTILIVEDEALVCEVTSMEFEEAGYRRAGDRQWRRSAGAARRRSGHRAAVHRYQPAGFDRWLDGRRRGAALRPDLPVIYATGYSPDPVRCVDGALFFRKPYLPTAIIAAANDLMAAKGT